MSALKNYSLLLLILPLLIICSPGTSARRVLKGGCLNYGHSCLGAHGKRASWHPDVQLPVPTNQPIHPRLLNVLLGALNAHPEALASLHHPKEEEEETIPQSSNAYFRYNNGRIINTPSIQGEEDSMAGIIMSDALVGILGSRLNGEDARMSDRLDDEREGDTAYPINMDDYVDDRIRRSARLEEAPTAKRGKKENDQEWEKKENKRMGHKGEEDTIDLRSYVNWVRR